MNKRGQGMPGGKSTFIPKFVGLLLILSSLSVSVFGMDTYTFQVDISSFTQKELDNFKTMGSVNDPDIFKQTYLLDNTSYYQTLKITPKDDKERDDLLALVGKGFDVLGIYNKTQDLEVKQENSKDLSNIKSEPATGVKPEKP